MALIKCPECGKVFSDRAAHCPQCGLPTAEALEKIIPASGTDAETSLSDEASQPTIIDTPTLARTAAPRKRQGAKEKSLMLYILICVVVCLAIICIALVLTTSGVFNSSDKQAQDSTEVALTLPPDTLTPKTDEEATLPKPANIPEPEIEEEVLPDDAGEEEITAQPQPETLAPAQETPAEPAV